MLSTTVIPRVPEMALSDEALIIELLEEVELERAQAQFENERRMFSMIFACEGNGEARPRSHFTISKEDLQGLKKELYPGLEECWSMQVAEKWKEEGQAEGYDILSGEFEKDLEKLEVSDGIKGLLQEWKEIFGELPENGTCKKVVEMDLQLKPEWENIPLRSKCFPMSLEDSQEIEKQVQQLLEAGLVEEYIGQEFPRFCSPTFLVAKEKNKDKKTTTAKRMVGDYRKLNQRTIPHAGYLPDLESTVEQLAALKVKSKMDMRSGFWQVTLSKRAQELSSFVIPNGRVFKWKIMPFGLSNAPGVFQELMMKALDNLKKRAPARALLSKGCVVNAFFDDVSVGTNTVEEHMILLKEWFAVCQEMSLRVKLSKCEFMKPNLDFLGFEVGFGWWRPSRKKVAALESCQVKNLKELRSFLGACNFYRRHIKGFSHTSACLTDLTKKNAKWKWTDVEEKAFQELKKKLSDAKCLGVPRAKGEILLITDASKVGGGAVLWQWQSLGKEELSSIGEVLGVLKDGSLKHTHNEEQEVLVPLGNFNWKWSSTRKDYATYEQELLSGILALASQRRLISNQAVVWLCDQEAVSRFLKGDPPEKPRQRRWWLFLSQLRLAIFHIPGAKNEMADLLSRGSFVETFQVESEELAKDAFERMDLQLDLRLEVLGLKKEDYMEEFKEIWESLTPGVPKLIEEDGQMYYRSQDHLFCEKKLVIPEARLQSTIEEVHIAQGHPGIVGTVWSFLARFYTSKSKKELTEQVSRVVSYCKTCVQTKPNNMEDRGLFGALPIPSVVNDIIYVDFTSIDAYQGYDMVMSIVCGLSRFAQFVPCKKAMDSAASYKLLWTHWIQHYGAPREIQSDHDSKFSNPQGFWQSVLRAQGIKITLSITKRPESNGMVERLHRKFKQVMRGLMMGRSSKDWVSLVPYATYLINNQWHLSTEMSPSELFLGRQGWNPRYIPDPDASPEAQSYLKYHLQVLEKAQKILQESRKKSLKKRNFMHKSPSYKVNDYCLVHTKRFPHRKTTVLGSQWLGPYRIIQAKPHSVIVRASPCFGGEIEVSHTVLKRWPFGEEDEDDEEDCGFPLEGIKVEEDVEEEDEEEKEGEYSRKEAEAQGYYHVQKILKHRYKQGWRFLVKWEGWPIEDSTWEPLKTFVSQDGSLNPKFLEYCTENRLEKILEQAKRYQDQMQF